MIPQTETTRIREILELDQCDAWALFAILIGAHANQVWREFDEFEELTDGKIPSVFVEQAKGLYREIDLMGFEDPKFTTFESTGQRLARIVEDYLLETGMSPEALAEFCRLNPVRHAPNRQKYDNLLQQICAETGEDYASVSHTLEEFKASGGSR
jgi:hypothetical protein